MTILPTIPASDVQAALHEVTELVASVGQFDCGQCDPGCRCLEPEPLTEYCIGHCHQQIEVDTDDPDFVPFCGSSSCRSYAEAEMRADMSEGRI